MKKEKRRISRRRRIGGRLVRIMKIKSALLGPSYKNGKGQQAPLKDIGGKEIVRGATKKGAWAFQSYALRRRIAYIQ